MKIAKTLAIMLFGAIAGIMAGFCVSLLMLPPDSNFVANGGHAAPGDGFLVFGYTFLGLLVSIPLSAGVAWYILFRKPKLESNATEPLLR